MTRLEQRYRRLLRLLPAWYRADREEEMVAVFLLDDSERQGALGDDEQDDEDDDLRGEYGWPDWREVVAVAGLAVRTRFGGIGAPSAARAWGDTVRAVALLGLLVRAVLALVSLASLAYVQLRGGTAFAGPSVLVRPSGGYIALSLLPNLVWVPAYLLLVLGKRRSGRFCAVVASLPSLTSVISTATEGTTMFATAVLIELGVWLPVTCVLLGFHRDAPAPSRRPWSLALPVAVLGCLLFVVVGRFAPAIMVAGPLIWGILGAAVTTLVARVRHPRPITNSWSVALAVIGALSLLAHAAPLVAFGPPDGVPALFLVLPQAALLVLVAVLVFTVVRVPGEGGSAALGAAEH
ncbi:hypothetical protein CDG81_05640 [Actinopolyspora erythraea]|uniref:Integral membrane protein n=1 Tax=Actinopolyspora erythraea TaxID=414996 RepID=A0A099D1C8_9ACTN|nr:hypothetical protein [Actinopolyspora erythraea]ASU77882.1 hypothetical protein CDG81_05640 [Actinopolyspora erythraea]KGI79864.1 hypothetical protein IL38_20635 [Actinopolyspora erythraea]